MMIFSILFALVCFFSAVHTYQLHPLFYPKHQSVPKKGDSIHIQSQDGQFVPQFFFPVVEDLNELLRISEVQSTYVLAR